MMESPEIVVEQPVDALLADAAVEEAAKQEEQVIDIALATQHAATTEITEDMRVVGFGSSEQPIQFKWMVTFGDLLTLLLCFFLTIVSFSPLNSNNDRPQTQMAVEKQDASGTTIASTSSEEEADRTTASSSGLFFYAEDFVGEVGGLGGDVLNRLTSQLKMPGYLTKSASESLGALLIEGCGEGMDEESWLMALSHVSQIRGQLLDAGISRERIQVRILGPECRGLRSRAEKLKDAKAERVMARLSLG